MDSQAISLVRSSFKSVAAVEDGPERLARTFYSILFARSPETREFFPAAMDVQRDRLVGAIAHVVERLDESDAIPSTSRSSAAITVSTASPTSTTRQSGTR
ncbi:hypothetical protein GCM10020255_058430 [Rhodococcus baikonurensis]